MFHLFLFPRGSDCLKFLMIRNGTILGKEEGEMSPSHFICSVICSPFMIGAGRRIRGNNCLIPTSIRVVGFQLEFVSISRVINHMTVLHTFECSHWWKIYLKKNPLQDLLSSLKALVSTNESKNTAD